MIVDATVTKREQVSVEIDPLKVVSSLHEKWLSSLKMSECYINQEGHWEHWQDGHGSGIYTTHRVATPEETVINKSFLTVFEVVKIIK